MPAKDLYHESVVIALKREGWKITDDPLVLKSGQYETNVITAWKS